jgi:Flp pilus assembly protein TadG
MRPAKASAGGRGGAGLFRPFHLVPQARLRRDAAVVDAAGTGGIWRVAGARSPWRLLRRGRAALAPAGRSRGSASVEFGLLAPALLLMALGATDLVNFMRAQMRVDSAALQLGQLVSQCNRITTPGDTDQFWTYAQRIVGNLGGVSGAGAPGAVVISAVGVVNGANRVTWQQRSGSALHASSIGAAGATASLPGNFTVPAGQTLFVTEVFLPREPWSLASGFLGDATQQVLRGSTLFLTRAPDAPALQLAPANAVLPDCTA